MAQEKINNLDLELLMFAENEFREGLKKRKIIINTDIDQDAVERYIMQIHKFNEEDDGLPIEQRKPIKIYLNTGGGDVYVGMALCDVIEASTTPVYVIVVGSAFSMGCLITMAAHKRFALKHANFLIHNGSIELGGDFNQVKDLMDYMQVIKEKQITNYIVEHTKITRQKLNSLKSKGKEWYISAEEALEYGIVDEIVTRL